MACGSLLVSSPTNINFRRPLVTSRSIKNTSPWPINNMMCGLHGGEESRDIRVKYWKFILSSEMLHIFSFFHLLSTFLFEKQHIKSGQKVTWFNFFYTEAFMNLLENVSAHNLRLGHRGVLNTGTDSLFFHLAQNEK